MSVLQRRVRRYNVVSDAMVAHIVASIKSVSEQDLKWRLDDYERNAIRNPSRWVRNAPLPEVMTIITKLGFPNVWQMMDERKPFKCAELMAGTKEFIRLGKRDKLEKAHREHKYFCLSGREILKNQSMYSLLVAGHIFKPNPDTKHLLRSAMNRTAKNQKSLDEFIANLYELSEVGDLDFDDWKILFLLRRWDDVPVKTLAIHGRLAYTMEAASVQRHLNKLSRYGYLDKWGTNKATCYALSTKGWQKITDAKKTYFKDIRFWDNGLNLQILNENNGSSTEKGNS